MHSTTDLKPTSRGFRRPRVAALVAIAAVLSGLAYLRFAPEPEPVSVPAGARAGQLTMKPCRYDTEKGSSRADCGTLVVPENRRDARSRLIALPVTRIRARSGHSAAPIFRLEGGPGRTNMTFPDASRFAGRHDVVLVGYRGVDGSSRLDCPEVTSALKRSSDLLGATALRAKATAVGACAHRLRAHGVDLAGYTLPQRVDDLEAARTALGYGPVDLLSESAGTRTAMIYAWRHPASVHRSVMIGVNPPGHFLWSPETTDSQLRQYGDLCAHDRACHRRSGDLVASMRRTAAHMPDRWGPLPIKPGNARVASFFGLMHATSAAAPLSAPMTLSSWASAAHGDPSGLWFLSLMAGLAFPEAQVWGDVAAASRADAGAARRFFSGRRDSVLGDPGTDFLWAGGALRDAWPANPDDDAYSRVRTSKVPTLLVSGALDFSTPARNAAKELLPHLPNGRQVVLPGMGHTTDFWDAQPAAGTRLVNAYFDTGRVDRSLYVDRRVSLTPGTTQTGIAKMVAGTMAGLALLTVLSLLGMARRVRRRGRLGRRTSAAVRSVYPLVLGLGGWFLGALIVMTTAPTVPLDDGLLAIGSIGAPIALGVYWAWVDRDRARGTKAAGLAAAVAGAALGAWLGFGSADGLVGIVTTIAGAAAGANLAVIGRDIAAARVGARRRVAAAVPAPVPAAS
jgi:pimeloyl-ACP methyl ester carboxylesterase